MNTVEIGEGWEVVHTTVEGPEDPNYEHIILRRRRPHVRWAIQKPDLSDIVECESFEKCMEFFEGYNIPYKIENNVREPFDKSHKRVGEWLSKHR